MRWGKTNFELRQLFSSHVLGWWLLLCVEAVAIAATGEGDLARSPLPTSHRNRSHTVLDPCLKSVWIFEVNPSHPERPPSMRRMDSEAWHENKTEPLGFLRTKFGTSNTPQESIKYGDQAPRVLAIHAHDRIVVRQVQGPVRAELEAIAIDSAASGESLRVQFKLGPGFTSASRVVAVTAIAAGEASWQSKAVESIP